MRIRGTKRIPPSGSMNLVPGKAEIIIHPGIDTDSYSHDSYMDLIQETEKSSSQLFHSSNIYS